MKKMINQETLLYLFYGVLTTFVYFIIRFTVFSISEQAMLSVVLAQIGAILFAFVTNKLFVFKDNTKEIKKLIKQLFIFILGRLLTFLIDVLITYIAIEKFSQFFINILHLDVLPYDSFIFSNGLTSHFIGSSILLNQFLFALLSQILAIVINYVISKKKVFKKP